MHTLQPIRIEYSPRPWYNKLSTLTHSSKKVQRKHSNPPDPKVDRVAGIIGVKPLLYTYTLTQVIQQEANLNVCHEEYSAVNKHNKHTGELMCEC